MEQEEKKVVEEVTQPVEKAPEQKVDESKFQSAGDPSVIKVDLTAKKEEVEEPAKVIEVTEAPEDKVVEAVELAKQVVEPIAEQATSVDLPDNVNKT